jgi:metal-sulfur cluster biosynthetic enzyme
VQGPTTERVREKLRAVSWPGFDWDIVAAGFVREIDVRGGSVRISFQARTRRTDKAAAMEEGIRQAVSSLPGVEQDSIRCSPRRSQHARSGRGWGQRRGSFSGPHARSRRLGQRDSLKRASATIAALTESIEREQTRHSELPARVARNTKKLIP